MVRKGACASTHRGISNQKGNEKNGVKCSGRVPSKWTRAISVSAGRSRIEKKKREKKGYQPNAHWGARSASRDLNRSWDPRVVWGRESSRREKGGFVYEKKRAKKTRRGPENKKT